MTPSSAEKLCPVCIHLMHPQPAACRDCRALNREPPPDLSDAHVDRVVRHLFRAFDDANTGREPLHDFDVMAECAYEGSPVVDNWRALAREAIRLGAVVLPKRVPFDDDAWQREVILRNVEKDPHYAPYCLWCKGLVRMRVVERYYWNCGCGAQCDYRTEGGTTPIRREVASE